MNSQEESEKHSEGRGMMLGVVTWSQQKFLEIISSKTLDAFLVMAGIYLLGILLALILRPRERDGGKLEKESKKKLYVLLRLYGIVVFLVLLSKILLGFLAVS